MSVSITATVAPVALAPLLPPLLAMMALTALVWLFMYVRRLGYMLGHGIDAQQVSTPQKMATLIPEAVERPANNLRNLFELPVLFYALCLLLTQTGWAQALDVQLAWAFVGLRALHSLVHCTVNYVNARFAFYVLSSLALWAMLARACLRLWG
jgi:hypothetical protein